MRVALTEIVKGIDEQSNVRMTQRWKVVCFSLMLVVTRLGLCTCNESSDPARTAFVLFNASTSPAQAVLPSIEILKQPITTLMQRTDHLRRLGDAGHRGHKFRNQILLC